MAASILKLFPRRPFQLARLPSARIGWQAIAGLLLFAGGLIADIAYIVPPLIDDVMLESGSKPAAQATIAEGGRCETRAILTHCSIEAIYRIDFRGAEARKPLNYLALFQGIDSQTPFRVAYDPADPQRITTSWGQALLVNRIITQVLAIAFLVAILVFFLLSYARSLQLRKSLLAMASNPRPVEAQFVRVRPSRDFATIHFTWTDPDTGAARRDSSRLPGAAQPFWLERERKTLLVLAGPDGHAHALDQWLGPVVLSDEERRALGQAASETGPSMAGRPAKAAALR
jgi:hypothetical protein